MKRLKKCPNCGTELEEDELEAGFCPDCGEDLSDNDDDDGEEEGSGEDDL